MLPEEASQISQQMKSLSLEAVQLADDPANSPLWHEIGEETISAYYEAALSCTPAVDPGDLNLLYTPLHGTGARFVPEMLARAGFRNVEQLRLRWFDGSYTLPLPNQRAVCPSMGLAKRSCGDPRC